MSQETRKEMSRRRTSHDDDIISKKPATGSILRRTPTMPLKKELWTIVTLFASCLTIHTTQAASLLDGRYETTTDVTNYMNLAQDASKMSETDDFDVTMDIYRNGQSAVSLQSLSLTAAEEMQQNPFYHMFRYAFWDLGYNREGEADGSFDGALVEQYADTVVQDLFALHIPEIESSAAVVMNVWMASINGVFQAMSACKGHNAKAGLTALDRAVALWVGANQEEGSNEKGHLLYNLAENAGELFGQDEGETEVNRKVMQGFAELQTALQTGSCDAKDSFTIRYAAFRSTAYWLTGIMTVPLIQNLIHHTINIDNEGGSNLVELYALGIIPRVATCDPGTYEYLLKLDVLNDLAAEDGDKAIEAIQSVYSCLGITCADVGSYMGGEVTACQDENNTSNFQHAGYTATSAASRSMSRIDRDILQIDVFMKYEANELALDWYTQGWNSDLSLHTLAMHNFVPKLNEPDDSYYTTYSDFYDAQEAYATEDILNEKITNILIGADNTFKAGIASTQQLRFAVTGLLQHVVVFINIADSLKYATDQCYDNNVESAKSFVDAAAMFYIGSMVDKYMNSVGFQDGKSIFVMAKQLCNDFDTCIESGDDAGGAVANESIIRSMTEAGKAITNLNCGKVDELVEDDILPMLQVPLLQGLLKQALYNDDVDTGSQDAGLAIGETLSRTITPLVSEVSSESADIIAVQMQFQLTTQPVPDGFESVADALRGDTLQSMDIECLAVGNLAAADNGGDMCEGGNNDPILPSADEPTSNPTSKSTSNPTSNPTSKPKSDLAFGRYKFSDPELARSHAAFALDVRDMFNAKTVEDGTDIYRDGANAKDSNVYCEDKDGEPWTYSLASLSLYANRAMNDDTLFNIYKYALYEDDDFEEESEETFAYANDVILEALGKGDDTKLAAEATVVLQAFMAITSKLYKAVRICVGGVNPEFEIDSAVALWIGDQQGEGKFDDGWMMYSIAQSVEKFFGYSEGESPVNHVLMNLFVQAQTAGKSCSADPSEMSKVMWDLSEEIIRKLTQPMIQSLLFHMTKNSKNMVELYAVAAIPQCAACDPQAFESLENAFFSGYDRETSITDEVLDDLAIFLRCQRLTCESIKTGKNADDNLENLVDKLCDRLGEDEYMDLSIAGYAPAFSVYEQNRLDLDALEMFIMMQTRAYGAAEDIYRYGHHSKGKSLQYYAQLNSLSADIIMTAIEKRSQYSQATRSDRGEVVRRALQSIVSHHAVQVEVRSSVAACESNEIEKAQEDWDIAVALFVGSIEGILAGSDSLRPGVFLYALGNEFCDDFDACETSGEATVNEQLMRDFASGRDSMVDGECDHIRTLVSESIIPKLSIPIIQGIIITTMDIDADVDSYPELLATANVLTRAIRPAIAAVSPESASSLSDIYGSFVHASTTPDVADIVNLFSGVLDDLGISCGDIGNPDGYTLCTPGDDNGDGLPDAETPTYIFDGIYVTSTYVADFSNIAKDVNDMAEALSEGNVELAELIYRKGKNSEKYDENGKFVRTRSLQWFSTQSTNDMVEEPEFNMFMYALGNRRYADDLVSSALQNSKMSNPDVAIEAALVLNLWMEIIHLMHGALRGCKNKELRDDDGIFLMDAAVAYWIGDVQTTGEGENGHVLYALSEKFAQIFNIDHAGQSRTNINILRLFNEAKNEVNLPNACSDSEYTYIKLRGIVNRLVSQMAIPLIQGLIHSLRENDRERVKIYSHAYIPLVAGCRASLYESMRQTFFSGEEYNVIEVESIIDMIRQSFDCLGLACDDIGVLETERDETLPACNDRKINAELAGYRTASDVRQYSRFDLDMREMDVLLQMKAYGAVDDLYKHGKHVLGANEGSISLQQLATTKHRNVVPEYDSFVRYYSKDTFADDIIRAAIDSAELEWTGNWSDEQRRVVILKSTQVLVMYFAALQNAYEAVADCKVQTETSTLSDSWDKAAALLIGSIEGTEKNGTAEGYSLYNLAQEQCAGFGTCVENEMSVIVNEELVSLLYTGRGAVLSSSCRAIEKAADEISQLLLIPVIQGALSTATVLTKSEKEDVRAEAYVYGRALVPFVRKRDAAKDIDSYLGSPAPKDKRHTEQKIYAALATAYPYMNIDCEDVGIANGIDTCSGVVYVSDYIWYVVGSITFLLIASCGCFILRQRRQHKSEEPENNPKFVRPKGEMNHSMDLLEKAFSSRRSITPDSSHSDDSGEKELLNKRYIEDRVDDEEMNDTFADEDDDEMAEAVALTAKGRRSQDESDII